MGILVCAFPASGKSYVGSVYNNVLDLKTTDFKYCINNRTGDEEKEKGDVKGAINLNWQNDFIKAIVDGLKKYDVVLICYWKEVLDILDSLNMEYVLVYPNRESMLEYKERMLNRGNTREFVDRMCDVFDNILDDMETRKAKQSIVLSANEYLEDALISHGFIQKK